MSLEITVKVTFNDDVADPTRWIVEFRGKHEGSLSGSPEVADRMAESFTTFLVSTGLAWLEVNGMPIQPKAPLH